jgi:tripartite-type tricarboxylate transporter receptor subunit TctC
MKNRKREICTSGSVRDEDGQHPHLLGRRRLLYLVVGAAALPSLRVARAQTYPKRPVRLFVGDAPGGAPDIVARVIGRWLSGRLNQQIIVENHPGAGSTIALESFVRAPPDGYTLALVGTSAATSTALYENLTYDLVRDVAPVGGIIRGPLVMVVNPSFPARTVREFIAFAKANPTRVNMASAGNGTGPHLAGELFNMMAGSHMVHVPFRGGPPALMAVLSGQVQVYFVAISSAIEYIKRGQLRPLAVTTGTRWGRLPDVPTMCEFLPGYEASIWFGIGAPKSTPADIIEKLNSEINAGLADPNVEARLVDMGGTNLLGSAADFGKLVAEETEKWAKVVKFSGAKVE